MFVMLRPHPFAATRARQRLHAKLDVHDRGALIESDKRPRLFAMPRVGDVPNDPPLSRYVCDHAGEREHRSRFNCCIHVRAVDWPTVYYLVRAGSSRS